MANTTPNPSSAAAPSSFDLSAVLTSQVGRLSEAQLHLCSEAVDFFKKKMGSSKTLLLFVKSSKQHPPLYRMILARSWSTAVLELVELGHTYCGLHNTVQRILIGDETAFDLLDTVTKFRNQRVGMVQAKAQYEFCYKAIIDELENLIKISI